MILIRNDFINISDCRLRSGESYSVALVLNLFHLVVIQLEQGLMRIDVLHVGRRLERNFVATPSAREARALDINANSIQEVSAEDHIIDHSRRIKDVKLHFLNLASPIELRETEVFSFHKGRSLERTRSCVELHALVNCRFRSSWEDSLVDDRMACAMINQSPHCLDTLCTVDACSMRQCSRNQRRDIIGRRVDNIVNTSITNSFGLEKLESTIRKDDGTGNSSVVETLEGLKVRA